MMRSGNLKLALSLILFLITNQTQVKASPQAPDSPIRIAVLSFDPAGVDTSLAYSVATSIRNSLVEESPFTVLDREYMEQILNEQGFQLSGACNTEECVLQVGRILGVSHLLTGSVSNFAGYFVIQARIISVESGQVVSITSGESGNIRDLLRRVTGNIVADLNNKMLSSTVAGEPSDSQSDNMMLVAVLDLDTEHLTDEEVFAISERFRIRIANSGVFALIERNRMEDILEEQGFQLSGACDTEECVIQVGRILGVSHMIAGSVYQYAGYYALSVRIINVETGQMEVVATTDAVSKIGLFSTATSDVARTLSIEVANRAGYSIPFSIESSRHEGFNRVAQSRFEFSIQPQIGFYRFMDGYRRNSLYGWEDNEYYDYWGNSVAQPQGIITSIELGLQLTSRLEATAGLLRYQALVNTDSVIDLNSPLLPWSTTGMSIGLRYFFLENLLFLSGQLRFLEPIRLMVPEEESVWYGWSETLHDTGHFSYFRPSGYSVGLGFLFRISPFMGAGFLLEQATEIAKSDYERVLFSRAGINVFLRFVPARRSEF